MNFEEADLYVTALDQRTAGQLSFAYAFENGIARAKHLLLRLGGAPRIVARCVIITGSKGKGSTTMLVAHALAHAGYKVGVFTGPHLHTVTERFGILDPKGPARDMVQLMPESQFARFATRLDQIVQTWDAPELGRPTRFEAYTTMAYRWFEQEDCDLALLEVGIGGRDDTTNLGEPMVSVFSNISLEHTEMLGDTVEKIAVEKAGIMRPRGQAVSAPQVPGVRAALADAAGKLGCPVWFANDHWKVTFGAKHITPERIGQQLTITRLQRGVPAQTSAEVFVPLLGEVQLQNVATALTALDALHVAGFATSPANVSAGFAAVRWPGRFEVLSFDPLVIADGAHTPYATEMLTHTLNTYFPGTPIHVVLGVLRDKDAAGILTRIGRMATTLTLTVVNNRRSLSADQLASLCAQVGLSATKVSVAESPDKAFAIARSHAELGGVACITGSLHLVAEAQTFFKRLYSLTNAISATQAVN